MQHPFYFTCYQCPWFATEACISCRAFERGARFYLKTHKDLHLFSYFVLYQACYVGDYKWSLMSQYVHPTFDNTKLLHSCRTACPLIRSSLAESFVWSKQWFCESRGTHCGNVKDVYIYIYRFYLSNEVRRKQNNQWQWQPILISEETQILRVTMTIAVTLRSSFAFRICQTIIRGLLSTGKVLCWTIQEKGGTTANGNDFLGGEIADRDFTSVAILNRHDAVI